MQKVNIGRPITCDCGKLIAVEKNGRIFVKCQRCKREIEVTTESRSHRAQRPPVHKEA